ncbi:GNAT family N-acetyltransferase [Bacillus weihaiensis]|uniref:GNAT family acetyltransferase n=1 Tax=Bacillus weihaiensis TaxID=1547283 RepID=A0A1L3MR26_9BACI|nr:GNAT family N-acetyltransferase [Bacillus weihaiensis]APH04793.1 GNAT family acetyltransferase [Bacillus weihaiensis]
MKITISKDFETIARLNKSIHDIHAKLYPEYFKPYEENEIKATFEKLIQNEHFMFFILEEKEQTIGYIWIEIRDFPENAFKMGYQSIYLHQISLIEAERKKGYGTLIMKYIEDLAKKLEIDLIELDYWVDNKVAECFYEKNHFVKYREFVHKRI